MIRNPNVGVVEQHLALVLGMIFLLCASMQSEAQTLEAPDTVCPGDRFAVEWTGPDAAGDTITIAGQQAAPDAFFDSTQTADGNPATLRAPLTLGAYDVRYVQNAQDILATDELIVGACYSSGDSEEEEYPAVALRVHGTQIDYGDQINRSQDTPFGPAGYTIDQLCGASNEIGTAMQMMVDHVDAEMQAVGSPISFDTLRYIPGAPTRASIEQDMRNLRDSVCNQPPPKTTVQPFVITYAYCRMAMYTPSHAMDIHLPPGTGDGTMSAADHVEREVMKMTLQRNIRAVQATTGKGWDGGLSLSAPQPATPRIGYPTREYDFEYTSGLGGGDGDLGMVAGMITTKAKGTMWSSQDVAGIEIPRIFYERLTREVQPEGGAMSFFAGLISNLVNMLSVGLPLEIDQTNSSRVMGVTTVSGRSRNIISSVQMVDFDREWCNETLMPASYAVTDIDAQVAEALGGTDSNQMREYNQAMEQMTPEQRAIMESMGMGDMMNQAAAATAQTGSSNVSPPDTHCASRSSDLTTDNLTQTVQLHLQALGFDPGNTNGKESLHTKISVSQLQAEKGLEVTGEISPQLLGILAAEVDSGC